MLCLRQAVAAQPFDSIFFKDAILRCRRRPLSLMLCDYFFAFAISSFSFR